jgi:ornithine cyclodeaminase
LLHEVRPGTHITAVGSDTAQKQELSPQILARCDRLVVDSRAQAQHRGEVFQAAGSGAIDRAQVVELGEIIAGSVTGRSAEEQITVADLTGVATQDIEIAKAIYKRLAHAH